MLQTQLKQLLPRSTKRDCWWTTSTSTKPGSLSWHHCNRHQHYTALCWVKRDKTLQRVFWMACHYWHWASQHFILVQLLGHRSNQCQHWESTSETYGQERQSTCGGLNRYTPRFMCLHAWPQRVAPLGGVASLECVTVEMDFEVTYVQV